MIKRRVRWQLWLYILHQMAGPVLFGTFVLTMLVWLANSLRLLDLIINGGQSATTFVYLTVLALPSLLTVILPLALFCGLLYALNRLHSDSEIVIMWSAGVGRWSIAGPVLALAGFLMVLNYFLGLYLMPAGYRLMKDRIYEIRGDLTAAFVREGQFVTKVKGLTVYISSAPSGGDLKGILIHDNRDREKPRTYIAERGVFLKTPEGPRLVMAKAQVQITSDKPGRMQILEFERYPLDLGEFISNNKRKNTRDLSERFLGELFHPEERIRKRPDRHRRLIAEAHNRLASPLYNLVAALLAFVAVICGPFTRRGITKRIVIGVLAMLVIRGLGFGVQALGTSSVALNAFQYIVPLGAIFMLTFMINGWTPKRLLPWGAPKEGASA